MELREAAGPSVRPLVVAVAAAGERVHDADVTVGPGEALTPPDRPYVVVARARAAEAQALWPRPLAVAANANAWGALDRYFADRPFLYALARNADSDRPALVTSAGSLSHRQMWAAARRVASALWRRGVRKGTHVTVALPLGTDWAVSLLAAMLLGAPYDAPDPTAKAAALDHARSLWSPALVLCRRGDGRFEGWPVLHWDDAAASAEEAGMETVLETGVEPSDVVMIDWTTGSTGQPKGVATNYATLTSMLGWWWCQQPLSSEEDVCAVGLFGLWYWWSPLCQGRASLISSPEELRDPERMAEVLEEKRAGRVLCLTPSLLRLLDLDRLRGTLRTVVVSGEALDNALVRSSRAALGAGSRVLNLLSTCEAGDVCCGDVTGDDENEFAHVGGPVHNVTVRRAEDGELLVSGVGVPPGACYCGNAEATAAAFVDDGGRRHWRTKDACVFEVPSPDAPPILRLRGRLNRTTKVRGYKVNLGDVEALLPSGSKCVVGGDRLAAFVPKAVLRSDDVRAAVADIRTAIADKLPAWHVPLVSAVTELPRTRTGKIDATALSQWAARGVPSGYAVGAAARPTAADPYEREARSMWEEVLGPAAAAAAADDSFFEVGGTSLLAVALARRLGVRAPDIWARPTLRGQAALLRDRSGDGAAAAVPNGTAQATDDGDIAIVGLAVRWPGGMTSVRDVWEALSAGTDCGRDLTEEELAKVPEAVRQRSDYVARTYDLPDALVQTFDAEFWGMSAAAAARIDPAHRAALEMAWEAWSGEQDCGVYLAAGSLPHYLTDVLGDDILEMRMHDPALYFDTECGNDKDYVATRVAFQLGLTGPAVNVQTACSSGLSAVAHAVDAIRSGRCASALAGAVSLMLPQHTGYCAPEGMIWSRDGKCRPFDAAATGTVSSNGGAVFMLKRLSEAVRSGDEIHAVIAGVGINNDGGRKASFHAPSVDGQVECIRRALADAGLPARDLGMVECHGTGTLLGDPIELAALKQVYGSAGRVSLHSVKGTSGHANTAAGALGLVEAVLSVREGQRVPVAHYRTPNPHAGLEDGPFSVSSELERWADDRRVCAVSSFGIGGTNVHMLLRNHSSSVTEPPPSPWPSVLPVSAKSVGAVTAALAAARGFRPDEAEAALAARPPLPLRAAPLASDTAAPTPTTHRARPVVLLLPGQGSQYEGIGDGLKGHPSYARAAGRCEAALGPAERRPADTAEGACTALLTHALACIEVLRDSGVEPVAYVGHSVGQWVAAAAAGVWDLGTAADLIATRGRLLDTLPPGGAMLTVAADVDDPPEGTEVACRNAPGRSVLSGQLDRLQAVSAEYEAKGVRSKLLRTAGAFHSSAVDPILPGIAAALRQASAAGPSTPVGCNLTGGWLSEQDATDPFYWTQQVRSTVHFGDCLTAAAAAYPGCVFVDLGPGHLAQLARSVGPAVALSRLPGADAVPEPVAFCRGLARMWELGGAVDWRRWAEAKVGGERVRRAALPPYAWQRAAAWPKRRDRGRVAAYTDDAPKGGLWYGVEWLEAVLRKRPAGAVVPVWPLGNRVAAENTAFRLCASAEDFGAAVAAHGEGVIGAGCGNDAEAALLLAVEGVQAVLAAGADGSTLHFVVPRTAAAAAVVGFARALEHEHSELRVVRCITDTPNAPVLLSSCSEALLCGGKEYVPRLRRRDPPSARASTSPAGGRFVVTGGSAGVGAELCRWLVQGGAEKVVAVSRSGRAPCAAVEGIAADVGDAAAVRGVLSHVGSVTGVFHAAGVVADGAVANWTPDRVSKGVRAKLSGTDAVLSAAEEHTGCFVVLFSSSSACLAPPGQSVYAAANLYQDRAAEAARALGRKVCAVQWGGWKAGMTVDHSIQPHPGEAFLDVGTGLRALWSIVEVLREGAALPEELVVAPMTDWRAYCNAARIDTDLIQDLLSESPLLGRRVDATSGSAWVSTGGLEWASGHVVDGQAVMPATGWLEMMAEAAVRETGCVSLRDVRFENPLVVSGGGELNLRTEVVDGRVRVLDGGSGVVYARCAIESAAGAVPTASAHAAAAAAAAAFPPSGDAVDELYQGMHSAGFEYGDGFRLLSHMRVQGSVAESSVTPAPWQTGGSSRCALRVHPAALDACTHPLSAVAPTGFSSLPVGVQRVVLVPGAGHAGPAESFGSVCAHQLGILSCVVSADGWTLVLDDFRTASLPSPPAPLQAAEEVWGEEERLVGGAAVAGRWLAHGPGSESVVAAAGGRASPVCGTALASDSGPVGGAVLVGAAGAEQLVAVAEAVAASPLVSSRVWCVGFPSAAAAAFEQVSAQHPAALLTWVDAEPAPGPVARLLQSPPRSHWLRLDCGAGTWRPLAMRKVGEGDLPAAPTGGESWRVSVGPKFESELQRAERVEPGAGEVELETEVWALNFLDVLLATGAVALRVAGEASSIGGECVGVVRRVGKGVSGFSPGDRVAAIANGGFGLFTNVRASFAVQVPAAIASGDASTVSLAYATALLACERARVRSGDTVLVHSAAGGVGLASVELLHRRGCTVYATCSSQAKRDALAERGVDPSRIFNSRDVADWHGGVMRCTGGRGVDVVFNSLAGEAMRASLRTVASNGVFVEIGKRDQMQHEPVDSAVFLRGLTYTTAHLDVLMDSAPEEVARLLRSVWAEPAPLPRKTGTIADLTPMLLELARGSHIGKLCVETRGAGRLLPAKQPEAGAAAVADPAAAAVARADDGGCLIVPAADGRWGRAAALAARRRRIHVGVRSDWRDLRRGLRGHMWRDRAASPQEHTEDVLPRVLEVVSNVLGRAADPELSLAEMGVDSLTSLQLQQQLRRLVRRRVDATVPLSKLVCAGRSAARRQRPRVLCLHGFRTSAAVFEAQFGAAAEALGIDPVYVDAPRAASGPSPTPVAGCEWWGGVSDTSYETGWKDPAGHLGLRDTERALQEACKRFGPFEGVVGFSQGAAACMHVMSAAPPQWALLLSPVPWPDELPPPSTRSIVVYDPAEATADEARDIAAGIDAEVALHDCGHRVPPLDHACWKDVLRWLGSVRGA